VTWNPVGASVVEGVAGRYFLPLALFLTLALEGGDALLPARGRLAPLRLAGTALVLAFPLISVVVTLAAVETRYH
jgi:hypothetical protein